MPIAMLHRDKYQFVKGIGLTRLGFEPTTSHMGSLPGTTKLASPSEDACLVEKEGVFFNCRKEFREMAS